MSRVEVPDSCPDFEGLAASGFRPKLHSRAESLSLESLNMSRAVGRESLDIPKFGREILDKGRETLDYQNLVAKSCAWVAKVCVQRPISILLRPNFAI